MASPPTKNTCSLFLKIISAVALTANGIILLILLHTPIGFGAGIASLFAGGLALFAASRERKAEAPSPPPAHLVAP